MTLTRVSKRSGLDRNFPMFSFQPPTSSTKKSHPTWLPQRLWQLLPGASSACVIAMAATLVSTLYGGPQLLFALFFGLGFHYLRNDATTKPGIEFCSRTVLRLGVGLLGASITASQIAGLGWSTAAIVIAAVVTTMLCGSLLERRLGLKLVSPTRRRDAVLMLMERFRVSQRIACRLVGQPRATQRYEAVPRAGESALTHAILELANLYGRYGYRTVTGLLQQQGWAVQHGRVWRIWQAEGLKVPIKQKPRGRLFLNDVGRCNCRF